MPQILCEVLVSHLADHEQIQDIAQFIQIGFQSGQGIWQALMNNPIAFGVVVGGAIAVFIRRWWWRIRH